MAKSNSLIKKINRAFLLQAGLISIAALLSVYFAKIVIDEILIKSALEQESAYFWKNYEHNNSFNLPDTLNLTGYRNKNAIREIDPELISDQPGFHEYQLADRKLVLFLSTRNRQPLYLVYNRGQVDTLAAFYGLFPLSLVLIVLYLALWLTYRFSRRTLSPVIRLAQQVNKIDFKSVDLSLLKEDQLYYDSDDDIQVLFEAIVHMGERLESYISRERNFTRDASHELRSPLTVINIATDMLLSDQNLSASAQKTIQRIKRAIADMGELTEAFLLLARETDSALSRDLVSINSVIREELYRSELLKQKKNISIRFEPECDLTTYASDKVLSVLIGNLIRNAILYTDEGSIEITINDRSVVISDSGQGIEKQKVKELFKPFVRGDNNNNSHGHGVGLTIVKRLSERFNWPVSIKSLPGEGTTVVVDFPDATVQQI
jgi:signal transduction histidine kinase